LQRSRKCFFIISGIVLATLMAAVVFLGVRSMNETLLAVSSEAPAYEDPSQAFRIARQQLRSMQKAQLNEVAHGGDADAELAAMAQRQLLDLCKREEQELNLEGMLSMRGYQNPIVMVQQNSVNVLIEAEIITQQDSSLILDMICRETGMESGNVKIIPIN